MTSPDGPSPVPDAPSSAPDVLSSAPDAAASPPAADGPDDAPHGGRISSGIAALDHVLGGGLPRYAICVLTGPPGSGKTIMAQQCVFANATRERPGVYLSTVSEPLEKILRYGQTLSFFDAAAIGTRVHYDDLGGTLGTEGLPGVLAHLRELIRRHQPSVLAIDGFKALQPYAESTHMFRRFLHELSGMLSAFPVTTLWIGEYDEAEVANAPELAVADAIISLSTGEVAERVGRMLSVRKLRGGDYRSGRHAYRISEAGLSVFPRLADPPQEEDYSVERERVSSGIPALDVMLSDGYWPGASTLLAGPTGIGKTVMGLQFLFHGARHGEPGVIAAFQENPPQLEHMIQPFGWSLAHDNVHLLYRNPIDLYLDEWVYDLLDDIERTGARRVLIDSLSELEFTSIDMTRFREFTYSLLSRCLRRGVSVMMTYEVPELFGLRTLGGHGAPQLADNILVLQYHLDGDRMGRTITVLKTRASHHDPQVRPFEITEAGISLIPPS